MARAEFLLEAAQPVRQVSLILDLNRALTPQVLKYFRVMLTITDMQKIYSESTNKDKPHPALCVGGRDSYLISVSEGKETQLFGVQHLVWAENPDDMMQATAFSLGQTETRQIKLGGGIYGKGPFKTLADLDEQFVNVYMTEPLFHYVTALHFVVNDYLLFSEPAHNLATLDGTPLNKWPEPLTAEQQDVRWLMLMPKGSDFEKFHREKKRLGHDPPWFPFNLYRQWSQRFADYTPTRLTPSQSALGNPFRG